MLPQSGTLDGRRFRYPVRVYYEDTDAGGIVYHAGYLRFAERGRSEFLRAIGWPHARMREAGSFWAVRRIEVEYRQPARLDDALIVDTTLTDIGGARIGAQQIISRASDELVRIKLQLAVLTGAGRPTRLPAALRDVLRSFLDLSESASDPCPSIP